MLFRLNLGNYFCLLHICQSIQGQGKLSHEKIKNLYSLAVFQIKY
jgi:hypothetical protein